MFELIDTFNNRTISSHRTVVAAVKASRKHSLLIQRANGQNSYIPKEIVEVIKGKKFPVDDIVLMDVEREIYG